MAAGLRFYNLPWGNGYYFHPDENNMASAITRLCFNLDFNPDCSMNPQFFAYGQFPLYLAYFSARTAMFWFDLVSHVEDGLHTIPYAAAIFWLRFWSAVAGTLSVFVMYKLVQTLIKLIKGVQEILKTTVSLIAAALVAGMPGLIQSAHFGTTESLLTLGFLTIVLVCCRLVANPKRTVSSIVWVSIVLGLSISTKMSGLIYVVPVLLTLLFAITNHQHILTPVKRIALLICYCLLTLLITSITFIITSPFSILAYKEFLGTFFYESHVATGEVNVFYTRQFFNTLPILFQFTRVFPYTLGLPLFVLGSIGFITSFLVFSKTYDRLLKHQMVLLIVSFVVFFLANTFLFVKWTRFLTPIFPFFALFATVGSVFVIHRINRLRPIIVGLLLIVTVTTTIAGSSYWHIYAREDSRAASSRWIYEHIPDGSYVLSETANVVDIPLSCDFSPVGCPEYRVISFDFYHLDENQELVTDLTEHLEKADYIFIPSRRIFANHMRFPQQYPILNRYYQALFEGQLGFEPVAVISSQGEEIQGAKQEFSRVLKICPNNPTKIVQKLQQIFMKRVSLPGKRLQAPFNEQPEQIACKPDFFKDEGAEETWTVFDHPVIRIYKKTMAMTAHDYQLLLTPATQE
ncbi:glycosyltransferase family 39 protein [Candidatus Roizmanbacteria bacterium]|nr:glycosyltransferase family 39 protein [Candidatus Roizmanbacteria bacterium]